MDHPLRGSRGLTRHWIAVFLLAGLVLPAGVARAERGPSHAIQVQQSKPVVPASVDVDLRNVPRTPEWQPGDPIKEIPRRDRPSAGALEFTPAPAELDPLLKVQSAAPGASSRAFSTPVLNFAGQGFTGVNPPDPSGAAGPNHYIQMINGSSGARFTIYSKAGALVSGPTSLETLGAGSCAFGFGDPIVLYDRLADRFLLSEFASSGNHLCVYVSKTANPVSGGWWNYDFVVPDFPDYPKYGVWPTAYFVGTNEGPPALYALDRTKMLAGQAATFVRTTVPALAGFGFQMVTPASFDGATAPPPDSPGYFVRHRDDEVHNVGSNNPNADFLDLFAFTPNFVVPASSTLVGPTPIQVTSFDSDLCGLSSFNCFTQPGSPPTLDPLREVVMQSLQYRNDVGGHETMVANFVTDVTGTNQGGVRWFELRRSGGAWTLFQEGTYSPDATNRWMGSAAMDQTGDLAVAYSASSSSVFPSLRYAGRLVDAPVGTLPEGESTLIAGTNSSGSNRWGDYFHMTVDPADDCTFWFTGQFNAAATWSTRIGAFKFESCGVTVPAVIDPPVAPLSVGAPITLTGSGITPGSVLKVFVATSNGPVDQIPSGLTPTSTTSGSWTGTLPFPWPVNAPNDITLGNGFVSLLLVRTDEGFDTSNTVGATLLGNTSLGVPSITAINGLPLSATSDDLAIATTNVEGLLVRDAVNTLTGTGFASPVVNLFTASGNVGPLTPSSSNSTSISVVVPLSAPIGPGSLQVVNTSNFRVSNATSIPVGEAISITHVGVSGSTVTVDGTGFNALTVINLFASSGGGVVNAGGLGPGGVANVPLAIVNSHQFTFTRPGGLDPGPAFVEAINPPFIPFTSSGGGNPAGGFTLP